MDIMENINNVCYKLENYHIRIHYKLDNDSMFIKAYKNGEFLFERYDTKLDTYKFLLGMLRGIQIIL